VRNFRESLSGGSDDSEKPKSEIDEKTETKV
jgi:hypothetical protein